MKKIKIIIISLVGLSLSGIYGCNDFIDEVKPEESQEVSTLRTSIADLDVLLNGAYGAVAGPAGFGQFQYIEALNSDFLTDYPPRKSEWIGSGAYRTYTYQYSALDAEIQRFVIQWANLGMNMANTVIESIDEDMTADDRRTVSQGDRVKGEGLLLRVIGHWQINLLLGKQYDPSTEETLSGIYRTRPILSRSDIPSPQRTVGEMYDFMIQDALEAEQLLPEVYDPGIHPLTYRIRFRKDVATAMLAKLYFQKNDLDSALLKVNALLGPVSASGSNKYPLADVYDDVYKKTGNNTYDPTQGEEIIYAWEGSTAQRLTQDRKWGLYQDTRPTGSRTRQRLMLGTPFKALMDTTNDRRFKELVEIDEEGNWWQKKFDTPMVNLPFLRSAEFHLMRAEILARQGNVPEALIELNLVRERSGLTPLATSDAAEIITATIDERAREMFLEFNRFFDMKRLGALTNGQIKVPIGERDPEDEVYYGGADFFEWDSDLLQYNLPTNEFVFNPALN